jgi:hypothetical protein
MRLWRIRGEDSVEFDDYFTRKPVPRYAILSHIWGADDEELTFEDIENDTGKSKVGHAKIRFCMRQRKQDGLEHFWIDSAGIDRLNSVELSQSIISMFHWYRDAERLYLRQQLLGPQLAARYGNLKALKFLFQRACPCDRSNVVFEAATTGSGFDDEGLGLAEEVVPEGNGMEIEPLHFISAACATGAPVCEMRKSDDDDEDGGVALP